MKSLSLPAIFKKDLTLFFRSKVSSILVLLIPLLIVLGAGFAFDSSTISNINIGVYQNSSSNFTQEIISGFEERGFILIFYENQEECISSLKMNEIHICSVFTSENLVDLNKDKVIFYVDYSRVNLANTVLGDVQDNVYNKSREEGKFYVQDLIDVIELSKSNLPDSKMSLSLANSKLNENELLLDGLNPSEKDFDSIISSLNEAKSLTNESSVKDKISNSIALVNNLKQINSHLSGNISGISSNEEEISQNIDSSTDQIEEILELIESNQFSSAENIISPINLEVKPLSEDSMSRDYLLPLVISLIALFGAILLSSTFVLKEKKTLAYFRNFMTPTHTSTFILSTYLISLFILVIQFLLIFLGIRFILNMDNFFISIELGIVFFVAFSSFIFIGMFIGYLFRSVESVIFASMITSGAFLFFSSTILPLESLSTNIFKFSFLNPLVLLDSALKKVMIFNLGFSEISFELSILFGFFVIFLFLTYFIRKITKRNF